MARWLASVMLAAMAAAAPRPAANHRVVIPGGPFTQGSTRGEEDERPTRKVTLKAFAIDRTEVTRGEYAACVEAGRCKPSDDHLPLRLLVCPEKRRGRYTVVAVERARAAQSNLEVLENGDRLCHALSRWEAAERAARFSKRVR